MYLDALGQTVLEGDGSYRHIAKVAIVGVDLRVTAPDGAGGVVCSEFGGPGDSYDDGRCPSGLVNLRRTPHALVVALPTAHPRCWATHGSPLPPLPWRTKVRIWSVQTGREVVAEMHDTGPAKRTRRMLDASRGVFRALGIRGGLFGCHYRVLGGARYVPGARP